MSDDDFFMKGDISDVDADDEWTDISPRYVLFAHKRFRFDLIQLSGPVVGYLGWHTVFMVVGYDFSERNQSARFQVPLGNAQNRSARCVPHASWNRPRRLELVSIFPALTSCHS